jgi:alpha-tubulin suppressor-like RCC1 family protein
VLGRTITFAVLVAGCGDNVIPSEPGPDLGPATSLSGNETASCVIGGALFCWGTLNGAPDPATGDLGDRRTGLPAAFGTEQWSSIAVSSSHACGIQGDGTLWCWGRNCGGQLGDGTRASQVDPIQVGTESGWRQVTTGGGHSCAIDDAGALMCWGGLDYGQQLEDCATTPTQPPTRYDGSWLSVSSSWYSTHGLRDDGTLWRWRDHDVETATATAPFELPAQVGTTRWRALASGLFGAYGIREDGTLAFLEFAADTEVQIGTDSDWSDAIAARDHACAIKLDGTLWCWGRNDMGQLGSGLSSEPVTTPIQVGKVAGWTAVTAGWANSCAIYDGDVYCWGANAGGEIGIGMPYTHDIHAPARIGIDLPSR